jgi:hypothetical protein
MKSHKLEQLLSEMRSEARAHNRFLTPEYLNPLEPRLLAAHTMPDSRPDYLERLRLIEQEEAEKENQRAAEKRAMEELPLRSSEKRQVNKKVSVNAAMANNK